MNQMNDMVCARASHATCLVDRFIYACGGSGETEDAQKTFEVYDIQTNLWDQLPDCHFPSGRRLRGPLGEGYSYQFGGVSARGSPFKELEYSDVRQKEWTIITDVVIRAEPEFLKRLQFKYMAMMTGVQVNHHSMLVECPLT